MRDGAMTEAALREALLELQPDWDPAGIGAFEYLSGGYSNENYRIHYRGESYVLRVPERARPFVDRAYEEAFYRRTQAVRIPYLIAFDRSTGNMLTRYEAGVLLTDAGESVTALAAYVTQLHSGLPVSDRRYDPVALAREFLAVGSPPAWISALAGRLDWQPQVVACCHNDLNPWNVIRPPAGPWVTLDWEWVGDNDPLFDLVTLHQGLGMDDASLGELVRAWSDDGMPPQRLTACLTAFWLREYAWAHAELVHGNRRPEVAAQLETAAARLQQLAVNGP
jgi:thiamine kinase-like enzyme